MADFKPFTEKEAQTVKSEYLKKPITHISKELNITPIRIYRFLKRNKLSIPENISKKLRFGKGNIPTNSKNIGAVSWRKGGTNEYYKYIRTPKANWKLEHHIIWEKVHGKIKKGDIIYFIDGNKKNTKINNLKMISRAENMFMNHNNNYPKELIPSLLILNKLRTKIKEHEK